MPAQDQQVILDVLIDLLDRRIFEQRPQPAQGLIRVEFRIAGWATYRQIPGFARLPGEGVTDNLAPQGLQRGRLQVNGESLLLAQLVEKCLEAGGSIDKLIRRLPLCRMRRGRSVGIGVSCRRIRPEREQLRLGKEWLLLRSYRDRRLAQLPLQQGLEAVLLEQGLQFGDLDRLHTPRVPVQRHRHVGHQADELAGRLQVRPRRLDALGLLAADLINVGDEVIERAVLLKEPGRRLDANTRNAHDVVHAVADKRLQIDDLFGRHAPVIKQFLAAEGLLLAKVEQLDAVVDQLAAVLVTGADPDIEIARGAGPGHRGEDVVGLVVIVTKNRDRQGGEDLVNQWNLQTQIVGHRVAVGLVVGADRVAERLVGAVKGADEVFRPLGAQEEHVAGKAEQGVGRQARRARHPIADGEDDVNDDAV